MLEDGSMEAKRPLPTKENLIELIMLYPIGAEQACIHRSILADHKFNPKIRIGEDRELWFRITLEHSLSYLDQCTIVIRDLGDRSVDIVNTWASEENISLIDHLKRIDKSKRIGPELLRSLSSSAYLKLAINYVNTGKRPSAFITVIKSILIWPKHKYKYKVITLLKSLHLGGILPERIRNAC
jgi:hypothetical protein